MPNGAVVFGIHDSLFGHAKAASNGNLGIAPKHLRFDRTDAPHEVEFFTDLDLAKVSSSKAKLKVGWLVESPEVHAVAHKQISVPALYQQFDLVLTFDEDLLKLDKRFVRIVHGGCWIPPKQRKMYDKDTNISIIASKKTDYAGQRMRHEIIQTYRHRIDSLFGRGYIEIDDKTDGLANFRYSIVVENCRKDYYFTEKIIDCFVTGTVPLYWGCPSIGDYFDAKGIISFKSVKELAHILPTLGKTDYEARLPAIRHNFTTADRYAVSEDFIYNEVVLTHPAFKPYVGKAI